jgi:hypothetical protein
MALAGALRQCLSLNLCFRPRSGSSIYRCYAPEAAVVLVNELGSSNWT